MKLGFTGSREGMTGAQKEWVRKFVAENTNSIDEVHHGDCVGADDEFDDIVREFAMAYCKVISHPSNVDTSRAYVDWKPSVNNKPRLRTVVSEVRPPILRDCDIVESVDVVIATPKTRERQKHSGTWFTYGYAKQKGKTAYLIYPDGSVALI
jgi:hypothetical protein